MRGHTIRLLYQQNIAYNISGIISLFNKNKVEVKVKVIRLPDGCVHGEMTMRKSICTDSGVTEVGCHSFSSPPAAFPALIGMGYPIYCWVTQFLKNPMHKLCFEPKTFNLVMSNSIGLPLYR